ncbi:polyphosphate kinase 2 family protein [Arthrobacter frigidicola]|nr:polyphosphate kinase 2 family protein [Arthrobacter frigidicola]
MGSTRIISGWSPCPASRSSKTPWGGWPNSWGRISSNADGKETPWTAQCSLRTRANFCLPDRTSASIVRHVIGAVDPQGVHHHAFKAPTAAERRHDFLWRILKQLPGPGMIGVFDRSHYEDVLVHKVRGLSPAEEIERRYGAIAQFEAGLAAAGTRVLKVMLHISKEEQKLRLTERLNRPDKYWKYDPGDVDERAHWEDYQEAYATAIARTSTPEAPWYVVPADAKWYARLAVQQLLAAALADLHLGWPEAHFDVEAEKQRLAAS